MSPARVPNICMLWSYCEHTECVKKHFSKYSGLWSFPRLNFPQVLGGVSHQPPIDNTLRLSAAAVCAAVCVLQNYMIWLVEAADDKLFRLILKDNHILSSLLPPKSDNRYNLRKKHHNRELLPNNNHLFDCDFIVRLLYVYKDCY